MPKKAPCTHNWRIGPVADGLAKGVCKRCGEERDFTTTLEAQARRQVTPLFEGRVREAEMIVEAYQPRELLHNEGLTWEEQTEARLRIAKAKREQIAQVIRALTAEIERLDTLLKVLEDIIERRKGTGKSLRQG